MTQETYSIAEARNKFASLIHNVEETNQSVTVTRRGQSVAVILSTDEYARLLENQPKSRFWQAYGEYVAAWQDELVDEDEIWEDVRSN